MLSIKIQITAGDILDYGDWDAFCGLRGISVWAMNEGQLDSGEVFTLTIQEAYTVGLRRQIISALERASDE